MVNVEEDLIGYILTRFLPSRFRNKSWKVCFSISGSLAVVLFADLLRNLDGKNEYCSWIMHTAYFSLLEAGTVYHRNASRFGDLPQR